MVYMKYLLLLFVSFSSFLSLYSGERLKPLVEEDDHFIYYRSLFISSAVQRIEEKLVLIGEGNEEILQEIEQDIWIIKFYLGDVETMD